jgi:hypothetical protein
MSFGERSALEGMLSCLKPRVSIEIGRAEGGSLRRIATHSHHVISLDLIEPPPELADLTNVRMLVGDGHEQLPRLLAELVAAASSVDFVLVDGDHSAEGVHADIDDLLGSPAIRRTVILVHDSLNEQVRAGLEAVPYHLHEKVRWVDLDFARGGVARLPGLEGQCWGGFALIVVDAELAFEESGTRDGTYFPAPELAWPFARRVRARISAATR